MFVLGGVTGARNVESTMRHMERKMGLRWTIIKLSSYSD